MSVLPKNSRYPGFNLLQLTAIAALLFMGVLGFVFFFGPYSDSKVKTTEKQATVESSEIPVALKVPEAETDESAPTRTTPAPSESQKDVVKLAPKVATPAPVVATPAIPSAGAFESLNRAISELPDHASLPTKAQQAEAFSAKNQHIQAARLYEQAAEDAEHAGRQEEAQLMSLKSIEERRAHDEHGT